MNKAKLTLTSLMIALAEPTLAAIDISGVTQVVAVEGANAIAAIGVAIIGVFSLMVVFGLLIRLIKGSPTPRIPARSIHTPVYRGGRNGKAKDYVASVHDRTNPIVLANQLAADRRFIANRNHLHRHKPSYLGSDFFLGFLAERNFWQPQTAAPQPYPAVPATPDSQPGIPATYTYRDPGSDEDQPIYTDYDHDYGYYLGEDNDDDFGEDDDRDNHPGGSEDEDEDDDDNHDTDPAQHPETDNHQETDNHADTP